MSTQAKEPKPAAGRATRLTVLSRGATAANRLPRFSADDPLLPGEQARLSELAHSLGRFHPVLHAPERSAAETAAAFCADAASCPALRDADYGQWTGRTVADVAERSPEDLQRWMADPSSAPHGGETAEAVRARAADWLDGLHAKGGHTLAVTHAIVLKLLFLHVVGAPLTSLRRIDVEPLAMLTLTSDGRRWALRGFGAPLQGRR
ncbi:histidine phosphatase family protein [Shinella sp. S4-D37]|uniref:histidine phosphatase family protein n=1 Tax=Shinella sp. S4-D37 TaxID=3161999 RepID=UPI003465EAD2